MSAPQKALDELRDAAQAMVDFALSRDEVRRINPAVLREFVARKRALRSALVGVGAPPLPVRTAE